MLLCVICRLIYKVTARLDVPCTGASCTKSSFVLCRAVAIQAFFSISSFACTAVNLITTLSVYLFLFLSRHLSPLSPSVSLFIYRSVYLIFISPSLINLQNYINIILLTYRRESQFMYIIPNNFVAVNSKK